MTNQICQSQASDPFCTSKQSLNRLTWTILFGPDFCGHIYAKQDRTHSQSYLQCKDVEHDVDRLY